MFKRITAIVSIALVAATGMAGATATSAQCASNTSLITVSATANKTLSISNTNITLGDSANLKLTGNGNCVFGGSSNGIKVTGNNNYVTGAQSSTTLTGTGDLFQTAGIGQNFVKCNGNAAVLNDSDYGVNCH